MVTLVTEVSILDQLSQSLWAYDNTHWWECIAKEAVHFTEGKWRPESKRAPQSPLLTDTSDLQSPSPLSPDSS